MIQLDKYALRGVASGKEDVHAAIKGQDAGLYPKAFCKILPDYAGHDEMYCNLMHADTAGTKTSLAYLYWKETGDLSVWEGIAQDALVMNLDDMACVGCTNNILVSSTIARNKHLVNADVISKIIRWLDSFAIKMKQFGVQIHSAGGETADVGDIIRTIDVGYSTFGRMPKSQLLVNDIRPGLVIVGFASYGQAVYEESYNSGIGSNGLTSARHDLLNTHYRASYPESYAPQTPDEVVYSGNYKLTDSVQFAEGTFSIGQLLLSPTRTYLPLIAKMLEEEKKNIRGLIHCTGGGQTKVGKFITEGKVVKSNLLPIPPVFRLLREQSGATERELFQVFNMGQRLECYCLPEAADTLLAIAREFQIDAQITGEVVPHSTPSVEIQFEGQTYLYE